MWEHFVDGGKPQITWRMRIEFWLRKATNTHSEYVICLSTAAMVARTHLNVTLCAHSLSYFSSLRMDVVKKYYCYVKEDTVFLLLKSVY